jgi:hypothetical protein
MATKFGVEALETRDTPTTITGPLGGTLTFDGGFQNGAYTQSVVVVGPEGNTLVSEQGQFVVNPRTGEVTGTVGVVGVGGNVATGQLTGQIDGSTVTQTTVFTGPNGHTWTLSGVYVGDGSGNLLSATTTAAGPNGGSKSGTVVSDPAAGTVTLTGTATGPNGRTFDWSRTIPV